MKPEFTSAFQVDKELKPLKVKLTSKKQWNSFLLWQRIKRVLEDKNMGSLFTCVFQFHKHCFDSLELWEGFFGGTSVFERVNPYTCHE
jgi:hypothetical protein